VATAVVAPVTCPEPMPAWWLSEATTRGPCLPLGQASLPPRTTPQRTDKRDHWRHRPRWPPALMPASIAFVPTSPSRFGFVRHLSPLRIPLRAEGRHRPVEGGRYPAARAGRRRPQPDHPAPKLSVGLHAVDAPDYLARPGSRRNRPGQRGGGRGSRQSAFNIGVLSEHTASRACDAHGCSRPRTAMDALRGLIGREHRANQSREEPTMEGDSSSARARRTG